jgi:hypothetical protein
MKKVNVVLIGLAFCIQTHAQKGEEKKEEKSGLLNTVVGEALLDIDAEIKQKPKNNNEIGSGLREALIMGVDKAAASLGRTDGFFKDEFSKILIPEEAKDAETKLRKMGMGKTVDDCILSMNRAAEAAAPVLKTVFIQAINTMTINNAKSILYGTNTAATDYLQKNTSSALRDSMMPIVKSCLEKTNATKYWSDVFKNYNKFSAKKVNTDLNAYVTEKAMMAIFRQIKAEELNIRENPEARVSEILKIVFGSKD